MSYFLTFAAGLITVTALIVWYRRLRGEDRIAAILARRGPTSMLSSRAQFIDGANHIQVALSLDAGQITYENSDFDASIDVRQLDEVEYGSDLITGGIANGAVLRLRSHGRAFEFVLHSTAAELWSHSLPPHRMNESGSIHVMA
jgi:hypothetical protein